MLMDKVVEGLRYCLEHGSLGGHDCRGYYMWASDEHKEIVSVDSYRDGCPYHNDNGCVVTMIKDALETIEAQREDIDWLSNMYSDALNRLLEMQYEED